jgi:hypothetical protein
MFSQIDEIVTYGNGYDWETVYNFPIWLRNFTYKRIEERFKKKNEAIEAQNNVVSANNPPKVSKPNIQPSNSYTSKTSR